jgi:hypothetical protein
MSVVLTVAGTYNLAWAAWMVLLPTESFALSGMQRPETPLDYPHLWQGIGVLVGVFGVGYLFAATNPVRHWGVVLVGLVSKMFGILGAVQGVAAGTSRPVALPLTAVNDLVWCVPFALIVRNGYRATRGAA